MIKLDFFAVAEEISQAATCPRASVGAVLVRDGRIIATGYNGAPSGEAHCTDVGCDVVDGHCLRATHAEMNAIGQCAKFGIAAEGAEIFIYSSRPKEDVCHKCVQSLLSAGVVDYSIESAEPEHVDYCRDVLCGGCREETSPYVPNTMEGYEKWLQEQEGPRHLEYRRQASITNFSYPDGPEASAGTKPSSFKESFKGGPASVSVGMWGSDPPYRL